MPWGTGEPEHYILPRMAPAIDPTRPMGHGGWRSAWRSLRKAAAESEQEKGIEAMPRLAVLRFYDLRHQFVTELCEAGVPESVIRELAGHVDPAMMRVYSHPRLAARRAAVQTLGMVKPGQDGGQLQGGYVTKRVTKQLPAKVEAS